MDFNGTRPLLLLAAFSGGLVFSEACTSSKKNTNHCSFLEGDETCADRYPGEFEHCGGDCVDSENNDGCVATAPTDLDCWYPCGGDQTAEDDMSCVGTTMTETNASTMDSSDGDPSGDPTTADTTATTMGSMTDGSETDATDTTEGGGSCQTSADCMTPGFPVCLDNDCVPCTDAADGGLACTEKDATVPVCAASGECVQCEDGNTAACTDTTPVCDTNTSTCVGCTYHEQCSASACNMVTGACFEDACVVDVEAGEIIGNLIEDDCVLIVHAGVYAESVQIGPGITVALIAAEGDSPLLSGVDDNGLPSLAITGDAVVFVQGLRINGNDGPGVGVSVDSGTLSLDRTQVVANTGGGLVLTDGATGRLRSSIVSANGAALNSGSVGIEIDGATLELLNSTVAGNDRQGAMPASLTCVNAQAVDVRNSIIAGLDDTSIECAGMNLSFTYSALDEDIAGVGNVVLPSPFDFDWFADVGANDYHLGPNGSVFQDVALVEAGDYPFDIDGEPRPAAGAMDYAGADIP